MAAGHEIVAPFGDDDAAVGPAELAARGGRVRRHGVPADRPHRCRCAGGGAAGRLRVVANAAVGYDNIDVATARSLGVTVCNTPGVLDATTADLAFLLILAASRGATQAEADLRHGRWTGWGFNTNLAHDVHGATLGLVGYGRIAQAVARRAAGFDMEVLHTPAPTPACRATWLRCPSCSAVGHREPACAADRGHPPSHRRGGTGPHEADGGARQHGPRPGDRRGGAGRRA